MQTTEGLHACILGLAFFPKSGGFNSRLAVGRPDLEQQLPIHSIETGAFFAP